VFHRPIKVTIGILNSRIDDLDFRLLSLRIREKIVKANLMEEGPAKELTLNAARALAKQATPGRAASLTNRFDGAGGDKPAFKLPKGE
jgi:hypothetical protein